MPESSGFQIEEHDVGEYMIASAGSPDKLVEKVNALISKQWVPIGGPLAGSTSAGEPLIVQALIRSRFAKMKKISHA